MGPPHDMIDEISPRTSTRANPSRARADSPAFGDHGRVAYDHEMSVASGILARRMRLPRAQSHDVVCERDLPAEMEDGAVLLADRWVGRLTRDRAQPTV